MKKFLMPEHFAHRLLGTALVHLCLGAVAYGSSFHLVSAPDPKFAPSAGAGGDSYLPVVSRDGRYVLFGSTADNLVAPATNQHAPVAPAPSPINVYLRDRTKGSNVLVSVNLDGVGGGNGDSLPIGISTNGRYALFESKASNLVAGDTNDAADIFLRDLEAGTTRLVSASTNGTSADGLSYSSVMTPDGRYVAFVSTADNLVPEDTNGIADVFVRDMVGNSTTLVSVGAQAQVGVFFSYFFYRGADTPAITPDGRYVAFYSTATNLVPGVGTLADVYLRDLKMGTTTWASSGALQALFSLAPVTNSSSFNVALSDDGRFVAFEAVGYPAPSPALIFRYDAQTAQTAVVETNAAALLTTEYENVQNLSLTPDGRFVAYVANSQDTSGSTTAIRVWDAQSGVSTLASGNTNNAVSAGSISDSPVLDESGRFVVFVSGAPDLVTREPAADFHVYVRDLQAHSTMLVDNDTNSAGSFIVPGTAPSVSADAGLIAFHRQEGAPGPLNPKHTYDVLAREPTNSAIELVSAHDPTLPSLTAQGASGVSSSSAGANTGLVCFWSEGDDLVANDTNGLRDVFVRDVVNGTTVLVSVNTNGMTGNGASTEGAISADGRYVVFTSFADDLVNGDSNGTSDVFVRDLLAGTTTLVSVNATATGPGNAASYSPVISSNGQFVLFHSQASDIHLGIGSIAGIDNLFWKDVKNNKTVALTTNQFANKVTAVSMTPDGSVVALATSTDSSLFASQVLVWDSGSASIVYRLTGGVGAFGPVAISPNGQRFVYVTNNAGATQIMAVDLVSNTNWVIASYQGNSTSSPRFSADSRFLAYVASTGSAAMQVFLYDFQSGINLLISHGYDGVSSGNSDSDSPDISSDVRFISYRSAASNLVPGGTNMVPNIFLYDRSSGATTLITASPLGGSAAHDRSVSPMFSADGRTLIFSSWASELATNDFNNDVDVFAVDLPGTATVTNFAVSVSPAAGPPASNLLSWPVLPGKNYHVQFKQSLQDASWRDLNGQISIIGNRGYFTDAAPLTSQRFYRIVAF